MSVWTHVEGFIEYEIQGDLAEREKKLQELLGERISSDKLQQFSTEEWREARSKIPTGSEGSLRYNFITPTRVGIYGGLRDFEIRKTGIIEKWFSRICLCIGFPYFGIGAVEAELTIETPYQGNIGEVREIFLKWDLDRRAVDKTIMGRGNFKGIEVEWWTPQRE